MLDIRWLTENRDLAIERLAFRCDPQDVERAIALNEERRETTRRYEELRFKQREDQGALKQHKPGSDEFLRIRGELKSIADEVKQLESSRKELEDALRAALLRVPNVPHPDVPQGKDESANLVEKTVGEPRQFGFQPKEHWELGELLGILNFEQGAKVAGARFTVYHGAGAKLERALINFMLDLHTSEHGYREVLPPFMVNAASMEGTGQFPKFVDDAFGVNLSDYYLIPTAEVPVTNLHRDDVLAEEQLPLSYAAWTPCFRREAGSYGRDTKGLIRQHQFNKVELVWFSRPEESYEVHERLIGNAGAVLERLGLCYRRVVLASGDLGYSAAKCVDLEVHLPGQNAFREISSCSNFEDYQARRANIRYRPADGGKLRYVHTLNGSGLAVGRTVVAILENYQREDGSVEVPEALVPYMGGLRIIGAR